MKNYTNMPLLALRGNILFPHIRTQLDIVRPQSKAAAKYAYKNGGMMLLVSQTDVDKEQPFDLADFHTHGVVAEIFSLTEKGKTLTAGIKIISPARLVSVNMAGEFGLCDIETYDCYIKSQVEVDALYQKVTEYLEKYAEVNKTLNTAVLKQVVADKFDVNAYVDIVSNEIVYRPKNRQEILAENVVEKRLELLATFIVGELEIVKAEKRIANRVKKQVQDGQKEYYLREQMKAISKELGEDENEILEYREKIEKSGMPKEVATKANKEVTRLSKMAPTSPDASVIRNYVDWLCDLPWTKTSKDNDDLILARQILDEDHHGLEKIKERIVEYIAVMQLTNKLNGPILCFVGPPGVGKTSIVRSIARALGRKYLRVSLVGVRDDAEIRGHRRTYIGAIPGKIIYMMKQADCCNPVMLLDEIDKMGKDNRGDPASAMLEVLDPEQNFSFYDHYLEAPYDLSKVLFVCTANSTDGIPEPLMDRMEIIDLSGYTELEKIEIAQKFLLPKNVERHGIPEGVLNIEKDAFEKIIQGYTRESGVRNLEREIATICRKVAYKLLTKQPVEPVTVENVAGYLGAEKYKDDAVNKANAVGSATGLAWTRVGGCTLTIDATLFSGKGEILLTGKLGDVMKESARTAISLVRSLAEEYNIDPTRFEKTDIHIHIPEGAIPKDGPSAGITMATVIMSAFANIPVDANVAMTGEITLRGKVLAIGGLKEKVMAAYRQGIKKVIIPKDNEKDLEDIPQEIASNMQFVLAEDIQTVYKHALVK